MKEVRVENMFECPFAYEEEYQLSDVTMGSNTMCTILGGDCFQVNCPLKAEKEIRVTWAVE